MPIPFIMADDNAHYRESFPSLLRHQTEIALIAQACDGHQLLQLAEEHLPPLIITDIEMPGLNGVEACRYLVQHHPQIKLIALSMFLHPGRIAQLLEIGVKGFVQKDTTTEELLTAVHRVMRGEEYYSEWLVPIICRLLKKAHYALQCKAANFTESELDVAKLVCQGFTTKEIADRLPLSYATVETYRRNILEKAGVKNAAELAVYAIRHGIVKVDEEQEEGDTRFKM